jgi:diguanylate cyclase (GGDEF)-like protein/PAS domain S-box-containing protein
LWACLVFAAVAVAVGGAVLLVAVPRAQEDSLGRWRDQLSVMADDRKAALDRWVYERLGDAAVLAASPDVAALAAAGASRPAALERETGVTALLDLTLATFGYRAAMVFDLEGRALAARGQPLDLDPRCAALAKKAAGGRNVAEACLNGGKEPLIEVAVPIRGANGTGPLGVVLVVIDPEQWLFPFLRHWTGVSDTAETLLVQHEGNSALFLNALRFRSESPMAFRRSLAEPGLPAAAALAGRSLVMESLDYRGVPVVAATRPVAGTAWGLVVKVDRSEALAGYRQWLGRALEALGILLLGLAGVGYGLWHRARAAVHEAAVANEARVAAILDNVQDAYFRADLEGKLVMVSASAARIYGYPSAADMVGLPAGALYADPAERDSVLEEIRSTGRCHDRVGLGRRRDGSVFHISLNAQLYRDQEGRVVGTEGFARDISERTRAEEVLKQRGAQLEVLREVSLGITAQLDLDSLLRTITERALTLFAATAGELFLHRPDRDVLELAVAVGIGASEVSRELRLGEGFAGKVWEAGTPLVGDSHSFQALRAASWGAFPWGCALAAPIRFGDEFLGVLGVLSSKPEAFAAADANLLELFATQAAVAIGNARLYAEVERLAVEDELTKVLNRRGLLAVGPREVERARRFKRPLSLLFVDLDHFKGINDCFSHEVGDTVLREISRRIVATAREIDIVARLGGDEFVVLLLETDAGGARQAAERMRQAAEETPVPTGRGPAQMTLSIGVATYGPDVADLDTLIHRADESMYTAKQAGRNRVVVWAEGPDPWNPIRGPAATRPS